MRRACKITLKFATARKKRAIKALMESYRAAVNFYIRSLWEERGSLNKDTLARLPNERTRLSARYKSQALKQAIETVVGTKRSAKTKHIPCSIPIFNGSAILDSKFVKVECGNGSFDLVVKLSCLAPGRRLVIPTKRTAVLNKWAGKPGSTIVNGCALSETSMSLWVDIPDEPTREGAWALGLDIGMNKLLSLSDGSFVGTEFKRIRDDVNKHKPGSVAKRQAMKTRDNYIRRQVNLLPWNNISTICIEDLKNLKKGKSTKRGKAFRKAASPWTYRRVIEAVKQKAQENRVLLVSVPPAYTSQKCPNCGTVDRLNRKAENFHCISCAFSADADTVGAVNVLMKGLLLIGSLESPMLPKAG